VIDVCKPGAVDSGCELTVLEMLVVDSIERKQSLERDKCFRRNAIPLGLNQLQALSTLFEWKARTAVRAL
jgi:hypothetical protein